MRTHVPGAPPGGLGRHPGPVPVAGLPPFPPPAPGGPRPHAGGAPFGSSPAPAWEPQARAPEWLARTDPTRLRMPARPTYREPLPVRGSQVALGAIGSLLWMALAGAQALSARGYAWLTLVAGALAWAVAAVLARFGDRGAAVGAAGGGALGVAVASIVIIVRWAGGHWLLW